MTRSTLKFVSAILLILCFASICQACPNCKSAVASDGDSMAIGFALSIGLMMLAPAIIVVAWVVAIRKLCRSMNLPVGSQTFSTKNHPVRSPNLSSNHS